VLPAGIELLDAPALGNLSEAESGSLKIFVGAPASLVEKRRPLLSRLGSPIHIGPLGAGAANPTLNRRHQITAVSKSSRSRPGGIS
jgi:3-hydroxyisobutyrate dehydrogenase